MHEEVLRLLDGLHAVRPWSGARVKASHYGCEAACIAEFCNTRIQYKGMCQPCTLPMGYSSFPFSHSTCIAQQCLYRKHDIAGALSGQVLYRPCSAEKKVLNLGLCLDIAVIRGEIPATVSRQERAYLTATSEQDNSAELEVSDAGHLGLSHPRVPLQADDMQMHMLKVQPMVVPPLPWRSLESGGLLFTRFPVMRTRTAAQVQALQEAEAAAPDGLRRVSCSSCVADPKILAHSMPLCMCVVL